ncbi:MAG: NADH-quinone oxidoreductase subunit J [Anaerolineales bacterium]|jgi:NADH-quinone oxidoreductase subunit J|nr:NADH-quinone oxidoreductase subunit J [Anaerolineales bacterium]
MDGNLITFYVLAFVAIGAALGMLFSKNSVYSALFLILNFATVAVFYLILSAPFIAMAQVTVYAGAIMVLFLFVIMLLGTEKLAGEDTLIWQKPFSWLLAVVLVGIGAYQLSLRGVTDATVRALSDSTFGGPEAIGLELFNNYLLPFEVTSILLLVAMVGAIVLTKGERKKARK